MKQKFKMAAISRRRFNLLGLAFCLLPNLGSCGSTQKKWPHLDLIINEFRDELTAIIPLAKKLAPSIDDLKIDLILERSEALAANTIGEAVCSAKATIPSLCKDDFLAERVQVIEGIAFAEFEISLLYMINRKS